VPERRPNYQARRVVVALVSLAVVGVLVLAGILIARAVGGTTGDGPAAAPTTPGPSASPTPTPDAAAIAEAERLAQEQAAAAQAAAEAEAARQAMLAPGACFGDPTTVTVLVNKHHPICPVDYYPDLVPVASTGGEMRPEAADAMNAMNAALEAETGLYLWHASGFRSYDTQVSTYGGWVDGYGQAEADRFSARPGHSEHQLGLAMDVGAASCGCTDEPFGYTTEGQWVAANAWRFGYIVRYPEGYEWMTGYIWEPWHLRYVGPEIAAAMHDGGIATLEEYYGTPAAPDYP